MSNILDFNSYINESYGKYPLLVSEYWDYGNIDAVIHNDWNNVKKWLNKYGDYDKTEEVIESITVGGLPIGCLTNINVDEDYRDSGYGNQILEFFIDECIENDVKQIILIADLDEKQKDGFDLVMWYENKGFKKINDIYENPVMIMYV